MRDKPYYSNRTGKVDRNLDLDSLKGLIKALYAKFEEECYFQQYFGHDDINGWKPGELGPDIPNEIFLIHRREGLWPISGKIGSYTEIDLLDMIEFLYDCVSKPTDLSYQPNYGYYASEFNKTEGQQVFRTEVNKYLGDYGDGYELSVDGDILAAIEPGFEELLNAPVPAPEEEDIHARVESAKLKFRKRGSSVEEKRDAIRDLADGFERLKSKQKMVLTRKDESDLFNIINKFGIRHFDEKQKTDYDEAIWLDWMFYYFLATIHAVLGIIEKNHSK